MVVLYKSIDLFIVTIPELIWFWRVKYTAI